MSKLKGLTLNEIFAIFKNENNKFMYCRRNNGMISPLSMKITTFKDALKQSRIRKFSYSYGGVTKDVVTMYSSGVYLMLDDGTFENVNRQIIRLARKGFFSFDEQGCACL